MAITKVLTDAAMYANINSISIPITMQAGDYLLFGVHWRNVASANFAAATWNGQALSMIVYQDGRDAKTRWFGVKASASATANLTSTSPAFSYTNTDVIVLRSSTLTFPVDPLVSFNTFESDTEAYANPSLALSGITTNTLLVAGLQWLGWSATYSNVDTTTATADSPLAIDDSVQNTNFPTGTGRSYIASATGQSGTVPLSWARSGAGSPMYNYAVFAISESNYLLETLTPLVPNGAFSGTCSGFSNGAATLSFNGVSVGVTIASGAFSGTLPMIADNVSWPRLPATAHVVTLTQGGNTANIPCDILLPVGFETVRNIADQSNAVANFSGIVSANQTYLGYWFNAASNPLTTNDSAVFPTSGNYRIYQDSGVGANAASAPRTDTIYVYRASSGKYFEHTVSLSEDLGIIVIDLTGWTAQATSPRWDGMYHHSVRSDVELPARLNVFGDSITAGTGASVETNRWVVKLANAKNITLVNNGISGTVLQNSNMQSGTPQVNNGRDRYESALLTGINLSSNYIIAYGLNDLRYTTTGGSQFSLANYVNDYREIIDGLLAAGVAPINICLVTPYWMPDTGYAAGGAGFTGSNRTIHESYVSAVIALATEKGCTCRDVYTAMKNSADPASLIGGDNIHPNDAGHDFIYQFVSDIPMETRPYSVIDVNVASKSAVLTNLGSNIWWSNDGSAVYTGIGQLAGTFTVGEEEAWIEAAYDNNTDARIVLAFGPLSGLQTTSGNQYLALIAPNGIIFRAFNGAASTSTGYTIPTPGANVRVRLKMGVDGVVLIQTSTDGIAWTQRYSFSGNIASGTYYARIYTTGLNKLYRPRSYGIE